MNHIDRRPLIVAVAGPNGAGKSTFYHAHLRRTGLRLLNADVLAKEMGLPAEEAMGVTTRLREALVRARESFVLETVFSDPVGDKLAFLRDAAASGYTVVLCFIGIDGPDTCEERVAMRVSQGGHDVPPDRLVFRFPRTLDNLRAAITDLPHVWVFDNQDLARPFRKLAVYQAGRKVFLARRLPPWFTRIVASLPDRKRPRSA
ncbi:MAG: zeta toxin family protein [Acidobacteriota bacterium]